MQQSKTSTNTKNGTKSFNFNPIEFIYGFYKRNIRVLFALLFVVLISYPVITKVKEASKNKPFFASEVKKEVKKVPTIKFDTFNAGIYDESSEFDNREDLVFEHVIATWETSEDQGNITKNLERVKARNKNPILTIEPWQLYGDHDKKHLSKIVEGNYDEVIKLTCKKISTYGVDNQVVVVDWGRQADLGKTSNLSWAVEDPEVYKKAFRRWHDICKQYAKNIIFMWSAEGTENSSKYYPGDEYVSLIGVGMLMDTKDIRKDSEIEKDAKKLVTTKLNNLYKVKKPIYLLDYGVSAPATQKEKWISEIMKNVRQDPKVLGAIYFNKKDIINKYINYTGEEISTKLDLDYTIPSTKLPIFTK
jgi:beta-mannanase